jgi:hypothetical protein
VLAKARAADLGIQQPNAGFVPARNCGDHRARQQRLLDNPKSLCGSPTTVPLRPHAQFDLFRMSVRTSLVRTHVRAIVELASQFLFHGGQFPPSSHAPKDTDRQTLTMKPDGKRE